ncbi:MAG TPA: MCP four helix bundle domain-containing protein, partial [Ramlibacter sp.]|uniref:MCP four helix bundle domain-containing protein n=1 Tax=Ramlibacter sp. TaxID=1917967 RepID=UPI002D2E0534
MKLKTKLGLAFAALLLLTMIVAGMGIARLAMLNAAAQEVATQWLPSIRVLGDVRATANQMRRAEAEHLLAGGPNEMEQVEKRLEELKPVLEAKLAAFEPLATAPEQRAGLQSIKAAQAVWLDTQAKLLKLSRGGEYTSEQAKELFRGPSRHAFNTITTEIGKVVDFSEKASVVASTAASQAYASARWWLLCITAFALVAAVALSVLLVRSITSQLGGEPGEAAELARRVADGDLSTAIDVRDGDSSSLVAALRRMQDSLSSIVNGVRQNADSVATASGQISQGNSDLSSRTEEQASALQQTAASMKQLASTVKQNADNAQQGNELALAASTVAVRG